MTEPPPTPRTMAIQAFSKATEIPGLTHIQQRGRTPDTATFTLHINGQPIRIGAIDILWSQAKLGQVLAVTIGKVPKLQDARDWRNIVTALIAFATDVEDHPDETFEATVTDWLTQYAGTATRDHENAPALRQPYIRDDDLYIHAQTFAKHARREHQELFSLGQIRQALRDIGFETATVPYTVRGSGKTRKRSSTYYYKAPLHLLTQDAGE